MLSVLIKARMQFQRVGFSGSASVFLGAPTPLPMGCSPCLPSPLVPVQGAAGMGGWASSPSEHRAAGRLVRMPLAPSSSLLTISRVKEQLHLLPQGPDHITMAI